MANDETILLEKTSDQWAPTVAQKFDLFLADHAACERKAASLAMSLVVKYPDRIALIDPMVSLAREELEHFQQVFKLIRKKGLNLQPCDEKDLYVNQMLSRLRHGRAERLLDKLLMSGLIEARGSERFHLLAQELTDSDMKDFYKTLAQRESGHYKIFMRLAAHYFTSPQIEERLKFMQEVESQAMASTPITYRLH